jgi:plastocyanin
MIKFVTLGLAAVASLALVACGGGGETTATTPTTTEAGGGGAATTTSGGGGGGGGGGATSTIKLAADPSQIAFDTDSLSAKAGNITIDFDNPNNALQHDVCVEAEGENELGCSKVVTGSSTTLDLQNVKPGEYTFYCSVDGHEDAGMKGTLTVQ